MDQNQRSLLKCSTNAGNPQGSIFDFAWNTVEYLSGLLHQIATWICWISRRNECVGNFLNLLYVLYPRFIVKINSVYRY